MPSPRGAKSAKPVAVLDLETDPFLYGRVPEPFAAGILTEREYWYAWDDDPKRLKARVIDRMLHMPPHLFYAHNGGKFDWFYFLPWISGERLKLINGRIAQAWIGAHEIRDSFSILPVGLATYQKTEIDINKLERDVRDRHRDEILEYLRTDCVNLRDLVVRFHEQFGRSLTIGGTAIKIIGQHHDVVKMNEGHDAKFRPWYFGGRVQYFERGTLRGKFEVVDVNSMYPHVMRTMQHPVGGDYTIGGRLTESGKIASHGDAPYFVTVTGKNRGAFPVRTKTALRFDVDYGQFNVTGHELQAALALDLFEIDSIDYVAVATRHQNFGAFVDMCMQGKLAAEAEGDKAGRLFFKLLANSGYGKFGSNPRDYKDYTLGGDPEQRVRDGWEIHSVNDALIIWQRPTKTAAYYDVAVAASITGGSRAELLRGLAQSTRPIYCDTDSIICERFTGEQDATRIGAWKVEARGDRLSIGGKKLYALYHGAELVKKASKGVRLTGDEIDRVAEGEVITYEKPSPNFSLARGATFVRRRAQKT